MNGRARVVRSTSSDPFLNLAIEDNLLTDIQPGSMTLFLWRNAPCVVIGRHQNPWIECDLTAMGANDVPLVRRRSGGGTVYHDLGNTNFTFLASSDRYDQHVHFGVVLRALTDLGISAQVNKRNDIIVNGRKVSGSAFKRTRERSYHHGTLLVCADLDLLLAYLTPRETGVESRGIRSVRSQVSNLCELVANIDHDRVCDGLAAAFAGQVGVDVVTETVSDDDARARPGVAKSRDELLSWEWRFGKTPDFVRVLPTNANSGAITITVTGGVVSAISADPSAVAPSAMQGLQTRLVGARYDSIFTRLPGDLSGDEGDSGILAARRAAE